MNQKQMPIIQLFLYLRQYLVMERYFVMGRYLNLDQYIFYINFYKKTKMKFLFCLVLVITIKSVQLIMVPILRPLNIIPSWQSSAIRKISSNSNLLVVLTNDQKVYNWNRTDYSRSKDVVGSLNSYFGAYIYYADFCFDKLGSLSFNAAHRAAVVNISSQTISGALSYNISSNYVETQLTISTFFLLTTNKEVYAYNRSNYSLQPAIYSFVSSSNNHFRVCRVDYGVQYVVIWNQCNGIKLILFKDNLYTLQYSWPDLGCTNNIDTIEFNQACNKIIIQMDNLQNIIVFDFTTMSSITTVQTPNQKVYRTQFYGPATSNHLLVFYQNDSIVFYKIGFGPAIYIGQIDSNIHLNSLSYIQTDRMTLVRVQNLNIHIDQLSCTQGFYLNTDFFCNSNPVCLLGQYLDQNTHACLACPPNCNVCPLNICSTCANGYDLSLIGCKIISNITNQTAENNQTDQIIRKQPINVQCCSNCKICQQNMCQQCNQDYFRLLNNCIKPSNQQNVKNLIVLMSNLSQVTILNKATIFISKNSALKSIMNNVFPFLISIDDLWLFSYHKRIYTQTVAQILDSIRRVESSKFNSLDFIQTIVNFANKITNLFKEYSNYGKDSYISIENKSSGFYANFLEFALITVPINIIYFYIFRLLFRLFYRFKILHMLRQFTFNLFFAISILDGNIQFFSYINSNQLQNLFYFGIKTKFQNLIFVWILFLFLHGTIPIYMILKYIYPQKYSNFLQNNKPSINGIFVLTIITSIRNIFIGSITSFSSNNNKQLILIMNLIQIIFIIIILIGLKFKCFKSNVRFWICLVFALLRISIQLSFTIWNQTNGDFKDLQQFVQSIIFLIYIALWISSYLAFVIKYLLQGVFFILFFKYKVVKQDHIDIPNLNYKIIKQTNQLTNKIQRNSIIVKNIKPSQNRSKYIQNHYSINKRIPQHIKNYKTNIVKLDPVLIKKNIKNQTKIQIQQIKSLQKISSSKLNNLQLKMIDLN